MDMVRHDAPGKQAVALVIEVAKRVGNHFGDCRVFQVTEACAPVEIFFDDRGGEALDFPALVGAEGAMHLICGFDDGFALGFDFIENGFRE